MTLSLLQNPPDKEAQRATRALYALGESELSRYATAKECLWAQACGLVLMQHASLQPDTGGLRCVLESAPERWTVQVEHEPTAVVPNASFGTESPSGWWHAYAKDTHFLGQCLSDLMGHLRAIAEEAEHEEGGPSLTLLCASLLKEQWEDRVRQDGPVTYRLAHIEEGTPGITRLSLQYQPITEDLAA